VELAAQGLGGVAATSDYVIVSDRELKDTSDAFKCYRAADGKEVWTISYPAVGNLDYGNSPRATPLIDGDLVYLFGAFGFLTCAELASGKVVWEMDIRAEFDADDKRKWGECGSPLIADGKLIINPGGKNASLVALDPRTGKVIWKTPGKPAAHGSFLVGTFGGVKQIVGYDKDTLGGWDLATGKRLWEVAPEADGDFNVPTPVQVGDKLLVTTENNGTRLYAFKEKGIIDPKPLATNRYLSPDSHTPVVVGDRVFGMWGSLYCLSLKDGLKAKWESRDRSFAGYGAIVASDKRALVLNRNSELILIDATSDELKVLSRLTVWKEERGCYAHPALVGTRLYLRSSSMLVCVELKE
jgi:outer membrane protein assembly factor BamB